MTDADIADATPQKALRVDAERRRQALLCAAASVFVAEGIDAPLESVARKAGVGIATLYRRFPTRDALVEAVFDAEMALYADRAEAAATKADDDAWAAFATYVRDVCGMQVTDPAFAAVLLRPMHGSQMFARDHSRALRATRRLIAHGRRTGRIREDLRETDVYLLLSATAALVAEPGPLRADQAAHRMTELFLDAAKGPTP